MVGLVNMLLRQRRILARVAFATVILAVVLALVKVRTYTSTASFVVQTRRASAVQGLAAQFGLAVAQDGQESPNFYDDLIRSREILGAVADSTVTQAGVPKTLDALFKIKDASPGRERERTIKALRSHITSNVAQRTGVVEFHVATEWPEVSKQIAEQIIGRINVFNLKSRQSQASSERKFTEQRLEEVRKDLHDAEATLLVFAEHNRDIRNAPGAQVQQERLQREVALRQQVYSTLAQAYEQAKIEEVRDTPVISYVERPALPMLPDPRGLSVLFGALFLAAAFVGVILSYLRDGGNRLDRSQPETMEFGALWADFRRDLRRPWRLLTS